MRWIPFDVWEESQDRFPKSEPYSEVAAPEIPCPDCSILLYPGEATTHMKAHQGKGEVCKNGHPRTEDNTGHRKDGRRFCRICKWAYDANRRRPISHGTAAGYIHRGCRCVDCRTAHTIYQRDRRARSSA